MSVLFVVAGEKEDVSIISDLLDIQKTPCKPQYQMADPEPLVLYDCIFNPGDHLTANTQTCQYYNIIQSSPHYQAIVESNRKEDKPKYNESPCFFAQTLSEQAMRELFFYGERKVYEESIAMARYQQLTEFIAKENQPAWEALPVLQGDFKELKTQRYTPYSRRTKARMCCI